MKALSNRDLLAILLALVVAALAGLADTVANVRGTPGGFLDGVIVFGVSMGFYGIGKGTPGRG